MAVGSVLALRQANLLHHTGQDFIVGGAFAAAKQLLDEGAQVLRPAGGREIVGDCGLYSVGAARVEKGGEQGIMERWRDSRRGRSGKSAGREANRLLRHSSDAAQGEREGGEIAESWQRPGRSRFWRRPAQRL